MTYRDQYEAWLRDFADDKATVEELRALEGDEKEIEDRFYTELSFGTAGMRGVLGAGTNRMNLYNVRRATKGFADYINSQNPEYRKRGVVIAYDSRRMSPEFAKAAALVLIGAGTVIIWLKAGALTALATLLVVIAVLAVLISYMMRRATEGGAHARIFLREKEELRSGEDMQVLLGKQGRTTSVLRPAGIGDFDGVRLNVVTEGSFIERDRPIEIVNVDGARIVVRERQSA